MNGAESMLRTLVNGGVDVCFTNPGTSEMQFVAAADRVPEMRCVLCLFEGVASGAADGWARMTGTPASTLLHLGVGLANALSNLHNAFRAHIPMVNIVGDHATWHRRHDAPLHSHIEAYARPVSGWIRNVESAAEMPEAAHDAIAAALGPPSCIATLIAPMDCSWGESEEPITDPVLFRGFPAVDEKVIRNAAAALRSGEPAALLMSGFALRARGLELASRIANATGTKVFFDTFNPRLERGAGRAAIERIPYFPEPAIEMLSGLKHLIVVGTRAPVAFFAYQGLPSELAPPDCRVHVLAEVDENIIDALKRLAAATDAERVAPTLQELSRPPLPTGELNSEAVARALAALMPEHSIISDEGVSAGLPLLPFTAGAPPHDWLFGTGGSIGQGLPVGVGAAVACPDRRVICLQADGSGMYTVQALWTQARESLNVTNVIYKNNAYRILAIEHERVGAGTPGPKAHDLFALDRPDIDWIQLANSMGVPAWRATTAEDFSRVLERSLREPGPSLIEASIVQRDKTAA
jgi:acetolactate synthase-1/2/3 large subunit